MKIAFLIDQVYKHGGIEKILSVKANFFALQNKYQITIITTEQKNTKPCYDFNKNITFIDLNINYNRSVSYFHPKNLIKLPKHIIKLNKELNKLNPDIVVVCSHSTDTYFVPFIKKNIPKIKEFHYSKYIEIAPRKNPKSSFQRLFYKFADYVETKYNKIVVLNKDELNYYKSNNTIVIPNPLTFTTTLTSNYNAKIAIAVGRLAPVKGFDCLIDIWKQINSKHPEWKLYIYGDGQENYKTYLQEKINNYNLQNALVLKGNSNEILSKMIDASIYLMTSENECFPLVLLEAQSCGLPVVSFDCPHGPRNILTKDSAFLIPISENSQYISKLEELVTQEELRKKMGKAAKINSKKYELEKVMYLWENLFNELKE
jgi:glycosyltransferase involved in cell wall biosynthesis